MMAKPMKPADIKQMASSIMGNDSNPATPPMPPDDDQTPEAPDTTGEKLSVQQAGYLELPGATKDGDCGKVQVDGGISQSMGCCNVYDPAAGAKGFSCGQCEYVMPMPTASTPDMPQTPQPPIQGGQ